MMCKYKQNKTPNNKTLRRNASRYI